MWQNIVKCLEWRPFSAIGLATCYSPLLGPRLIVSGESSKSVRHRGVNWNSRKSHMLAQQLVLTAFGLFFKSMSTDYKKMAHLHSMDSFGGECLSKSRLLRVVIMLLHANTFKEAAKTIKTKDVAQFPGKQIQ